MDDDSPVSPVRDHPLFDTFPDEAVAVSQLFPSGDILSGYMCF